MSVERHFGQASWRGTNFMEDRILARPVEFEQFAELPARGFIREPLLEPADRFW